MKRKNQYPSKKSLNLMIRERSGPPFYIAAPLVLLVLLAAALFCQFGVVARLNRVAQAEAAAAQAEEKLARVQEELADYEETEVTYARYFSAGLRSDDMPQECMDVLDMLESVLMPQCSITNLSFSRNVVSLRLDVSTLGDLSHILEALYAVPMIDQVNISTAAGTGSRVDPDPLLPAENEGEIGTGVSTILMTITLREVEK